MAHSLRFASAVALSVASAAVVSLAGCTATGVPEASATSETPVATPTTTASPTAAADGSERLPLPVDDIDDWARETLPTAGDAGYVSGFSGWLSQETSPNRSVTAQSLPAGTYTVRMACAGRSVLTVTALGVDDAELASERVDCSAGGSRDFTVTTTSEGVSTALGLESEPIVYAFSVLAG
jgi:hypothetical protein